MPGADMSSLPRLSQLRNYNAWLAVSVAFVILAASLVLTLLRPSASPAQGLSPLGEGFSLFGAYQSPTLCRECHPDEFHDWSGTTHADASFDPIFQVYLQEAEQPGECLSCHTTGYDTSTGQFVFAGVSCEACHGPYRSGHPNESMMIAAAEDLCGACHPSTLFEWQSSRHGQVGVDCVACHEVHTQKTREAVVTNALCAGCHEDRTGDELHGTHLAVNVHCVDCHLSRPENGDAADAISGRAVTGHSFEVRVSTCGGCHDTANDQAPGAYLGPATPHSRGMG